MGGRAPLRIKGIRSADGHDYRAYVRAMDVLDVAINGQTAKLRDKVTPTTLAGALSAQGHERPREREADIPRLCGEQAGDSTTTRCSAPTL